MQPEQRADYIRQVVVAARLAPLQMAADESAMEQQTCQRGLYPRSPVRCALSAMHRAATQFAALIPTSMRATHGAPNSTGLAPMNEDQLGPEPRPEIATISSHPVRGCQQRQVLATRQLPRHLDVRAVAKRDRHARDVYERPAPPTLEVELPIDPRPQIR